MKRRSFLKIISSILPAAIVAKEVIEHEPNKDEVMADYYETYPSENVRGIYAVDLGLGSTGYIGTYTFHGNTMTTAHYTKIEFTADDFELDEP